LFSPFFSFFFATTINVGQVVVVAGKLVECTTAFQKVLNAISIAPQPPPTSGNNNSVCTPV